MVNNIVERMFRIDNPHSQAGPPPHLEERQRAGVRVREKPRDGVFGLAVVRMSEPPFRRRRAGPPSVRGPDGDDGLRCPPARTSRSRGRLRGRHHAGLRGGLPGQPLRPHRGRRHPLQLRAALRARDALPGRTPPAPSRGPTPTAATASRPAGTLKGPVIAALPRVGRPMARSTRRTPRRAQTPARPVPLPPTRWPRVGAAHRRATGRPVLAVSAGPPAAEAGSARPWPRAPTEPCSSPWPAPNVSRGGRRAGRRPARCRRDDRLVRRPFARPGLRVGSGLSGRRARPAASPWSGPGGGRRRRRAKRTPPPRQGTPGAAGPRRQRGISVEGATAQLRRASLAAATTGSHDDDRSDRRRAGRPTRDRAGAPALPSPRPGAVGTPGRRCARPHRRSDHAEPRRPTARW